MNYKFVKLSESASLGSRAALVENVDFGTLPNDDSGC